MEWSPVYHVKGWGKFNRHYGDFCTGADTPALPSSKKKPDVNLSGAANDFQALERLRKLAFAETVPAPKIPVQEVLELVGEGVEEEEDGG